MFLSIILVKVLDGHGFDLHFFIRCKFSCLNNFSISTDTKIMRSYVSQCSILILNRLAIINFSSTNGLKFSNRYCSICLFKTKILMYQKPLYLKRYGWTQDKLNLAQTRFVPLSGYTRGSETGVPVTTFLFVL